MKRILITLGIVSIVLSLLTIWGTTAICVLPLTEDLKGKTFWVFEPRRLFDDIPFICSSDSLLLKRGKQLTPDTRWDVYRLLANRMTILRCPFSHTLYKLTVDDSVNVNYGPGKWELKHHDHYKYMIATIGDGSVNGPDIQNGLCTGSMLVVKGKRSYVELHLFENGRSVANRFHHAGDVLFKNSSGKVFSTSITGKDNSTAAYLFCGDCAVSFLERSQGKVNVIVKDYTNKTAYVFNVLVENFTDVLKQLS